MAIATATTAQSKNRSIVPTGGLGAKLQAPACLSMWLRLLETAVDEAKRTHMGQPTDSAILARWWIEQPDYLAQKGAEFRATFERVCMLLGRKPEDERKMRLKDIDAALQASQRLYASKVLALRRRAILTTAGSSVQMSRTLALLLVSQVEYEETAGINRADPPGWAHRKQRPQPPHGVDVDRPGDA